MGTSSASALPLEASAQTAARAVLPEGWRRRLAIIVLLSSAPGMALMFSALGPALPLVAAHFNGRTAAQIIMTMAAAGVVFGGAVGGFVISAVGVRPALFGGLLAYALTGMGGLYVDSFTGLLVTRFLLGVSIAHVSNCCLTLLGAWFREEERTRILGYQAAVAGVVSVTMLLVGGRLADYGGWRAPFLIYLIALPVLALALVAIPRAAAPPPVRMKTDWPAIFGLWPIYLLVFGLFLVYFMTSVQFSFLLAEDGIVSSFTRSIVIGAGVGAGGLFGGLFGPVYRRLGRRGTRLVLVGLMTAGFALIGLTHALWSITVGAVLCGGGGGMLSPYVSSLMLARAPAEMRSRALGFMFMIFYIADFLNPVVVYPARVAFGFHGAFLTAAVLLLIGLVASWRVGASSKSGP